MPVPASTVSTFATGVHTFSVRLAEIMRVRPAQQVLVLSALAEVEERVKCLRLGAADYLVKPFAIAELVTRVQARLREVGSALPVSRPRLDVVLDHTRRTADVGAGPVRLTSKEYLVLQHLIDRAPGISGRDELVREVWGRHTDRTANSSTPACGGCGRSSATS